jgi:PAS domain S-box-containing protein
MSTPSDPNVLYLRRLLRDLVALSGIPGAWVGREPSAIVADFADLLVASLDVDSAFVRLCDPKGGAAVETALGRPWPALLEWLQPYLADGGSLLRSESVPGISEGARVGRGIVVPIGVNAGLGLVAVASDRPDFPGEIDRLLLSVATNHAATAFRMARLVEDHRRAEAALRDSEQQLRQARDELEMKVAERTAELRRSEAYLAEAQRLSHTSTWALNRTTKLYVYWSDESYRIWGFDPLQGPPSHETLWQRVHPDDRDRLWKDVEEALRQKADYAGEFRIVLPDGAVKHLKATGHHRFSGDGELIEVVGTDVDVTEHKQAEEALRDSEYKLRQIIETVPSLIWSTDPAGEPTQLNQRIFDYSGMRFEDFKHGGWEAFIHPDDFPETIRAFSHAIQTGTSYQTLHRLRRADGEFRWHHARGEPLRDEEGRIIQWYGLAVDINEAKNAEDRLRRSEAYLAEAQRLSHTGTSVLYGTTIHSPYLYWSDECYRIWGLDPLQGIPRRDTVWQRIHPDDRDRVGEEFQDALRQNKDYAGEFRIVLPDGTDKYLAATAHRLFSTGGEIVEVICTYIDVTERKRAQEEHAKLRQLESDLAHMNRLGIIGEQAASLVHEITQPVASARNNARAAVNFLERQPPELGEVREALDCIVADTDRAREIIDRIRDHIRKAPPRKARFDLNDAIDEVIVLGRSAIIKNGASVQTRLAERLFPVEGDRVQLQQVILNLVLNAVEAMTSIEAGPRDLLIGTEQTQGNGVLVTVRDSGPGIDPENLERVFEAFYTTKTSGVGIGLSICRSIIDAHGGRLWADANEPRGAVFRFILPGAETELTNGGPREGTVSTAPRQSACEDNR